MGYTMVALKNKIREMYPEIQEHGINFGLVYSDDINSYVVNLKKDVHELTTYLDRKDADDCMDGRKCVNLGIKISEFISNFET